jgi:hypothetical protein
MGTPAPTASAAVVVIGCAFGWLGDAAASTLSRIRS